MVMRGSSAAKEMESKRGGNFSRAQYFSLKDGESAVVRFIDDDNPDIENCWLATMEHSFIDTRDPRAQHQGAKEVPEKTVQNWPRKMNATCRKNAGYDYPDCYICENVKTDKGKPKKPTPRIYSRVCMRDEVLGTKEMAANGEIPEYKVGKPVSFTDRLKEVDEVDADGKPTGQKKETLDIRIAVFSYKNFYSAMASAGQAYGTVLDRDYRITRVGEGLDTEYRPIPMDVILWNGPNDDEKDQPYSLQDPRLLEYYTNEVDFDLEEIIDNRATDDYYERFFDVRKPIPVREGEGGGDKDSSGSNSTPEPPPAPAADPETTQRMSSMGDRLRAASRKPSNA